jgi:hypothetical protein
VYIYIIACINPWVSLAVPPKNKTKQKVGDPDMVARLLSQLLGRVVFAQELDTSLGSTVRLFQKANRK